MSGVLYARVSGAWVPIIGSGASTGAMPIGGLAGDLLIKSTAADFATRWGTDPPKLSLTSIDVATLASTTHPLTLGTVVGTNLAMYSTGIQARQAGAIATMRLNYYGGEVLVGGGDAQQYPRGLTVAASTHATSRRAPLNFGDWQWVQDSGGTGTKDCALYAGGGGRWAASFNPTGTIGIIGNLGVAIGNQPNYAVPALWSQSDGYAPGNKYRLMFYGNDTLLNSDGGSVNLRVNNATFLSTDSANTRVELNALRVLGQTIFEGDQHGAVGGWYRVRGNGGVYWQDWGGGWNMQDATWIRAYGDKGILTGGNIRGYLIEASYAVRHPSGATGMYWNGTGSVDMFVNGLAQARFGDYGIGLWNNKVIRFYTPDDANHTLGYSGATPTGSGEASNGPRLMGYTSVWLSTAATGKSLFLASNGNAFLNAGNAWSTFSSATLKDDVATIDPDDALATVLRWRPVRFRWKPEVESLNEWGEGFIAEEHVTVSPEMVTVDGPDSLYPGRAAAIDYANCVTRLTGAVQALNERIEQLERNAT